MKIGIVGVGVVGGALVDYLKPNHELVLIDPPRGFMGSLDGCEAVFICVPAATLPDGTQNLKTLKEALKKNQNEIKGKTPVFIRSTLIPKTCDYLAKIFKMRIHAMPEFLTERIAKESFSSQPIVCGCLKDPCAMAEVEDILGKIFPDKKRILVSNREAELAKYAHNVMGALKVGFFNLIAKYAEKMNADYDSVLEAILASGYINAEHTSVPGPDGCHGFGGKCFPKDLSAFLKEIKRIGIQSGMLICLEQENRFYREAWSRDFKPPKVEFSDKL